MEFVTQSLTAVVVILVIWRCINSILHHVSYVSTVTRSSPICILNPLLVKYTKCWAQRDTNIVPNCVQISPQGQWSSAGGIQKGARTPIIGCLRGLRSWQIGDAQHKGQIFKVAQVDSWLIIVTGDKLIEELRSAPEHVLSEENAMADVSVWSLNLFFNVTCTNLFLIFYRFYKVTIL